MTGYAGLRDRLSLPLSHGIVPLLLGVSAAIGIFFFLGSIGLYDIPFIIANLPNGLGPAETSLELTTLSFVIGFGLALPLGVLRADPPRWRSSLGSATPVANTVWRRYLIWPAYALATGYVQAIRGTPFLVQTFLVYYAVIFSDPRLMLLGLGAPFWAGLIALTINTTAYQAEALRGGFQSVERSQVEAGRAIGLTRFQIFRRITFPQGIRLITLPLTNEWISNFKTSAILSYIALYELFAWDRTTIAYQLTRPVEAFVILVIFYLVINVAVSRTATYLEARRRIPGLGTPVPEFAARPG